MNPLPSLGFGLGLRARHLPYIGQHNPAVDWFEIISENYMDTHGMPRRNLARIAERYPIVMHGVSLSIGTVDPLNSEYLGKLKALIQDVNPAWVSDHLCWTGVAHRTTHDLLPVPYTEEALRHLTQRIRQVQDVLERPIALENPSTYLEFQSSSMPEAEFIARMVEGSGCNLLLDVNNVYVTCYNHRLDPKTYLDTLPLDHVIQIHLAGHTNKHTHIVDTHDDHVTDEVWSLYQYVIRKAGRIPNTMIEWDDNIPEFPVLYAELQKARDIASHRDTLPLPYLAAAQASPATAERLSLQQQQCTLQDAIMLGKRIDTQPAQWIRQKDNFSSDEQLAVYTKAYRLRLFDVVAEDYPVLSSYLGPSVFSSLIRDFIEAVPPQHFNIARYATLLPGYQSSHVSHDAFAAEICLLETVIAQLADAPETRILSARELEGITPDRLLESRLYLRKALQLFAFHYPVHAYYQAVKAEAALPAIMPQPSFLVAFRHDDVVWRMDLEEQEYQLLAKIAAGESIGVALSGLTASAAANISEYFSRWMRNGLLASIEYHDEPHARIAHEPA